MLSDQHPLIEMDEQGVNQAYQFTYELAWNILKDYLKSHYPNLKLMVNFP